jgi:hypothetical protein
MPTLINAIKETSEQSKSVSSDVVSNLVKDLNYLKRSSVIVSDALQKGSDVMQLANGDIVITEIKTVTYNYIWNQDKGRFERANSGQRMKRPRVKHSSARADNTNDGAV